ncbi:hypothetical protein Tco_0268627 [Tanacetum coccineum]
MEDTPEAELLPHKEVKSLTTPHIEEMMWGKFELLLYTTRGHRADYGFIGTMDAEIRRQRAEEVSYGIRDVWVDPTEDTQIFMSVNEDGLDNRLSYLRELTAYSTYPMAGLTESLPHFDMESMTATIDCHRFIATWTVVSALGHIQHYQAKRSNSCSMVPKGAEPLTTVPVAMKPVQSMLPSMTPVKRYGNPASGCESYRPAAHSELLNSIPLNVPKPLEKLEPPESNIMHHKWKTVYPWSIHQLSEITESVCPDHPRSQHKYPECPAPAPQQARSL